MNRDKGSEKVLKELLKELPYFSYRGHISDVHGRFNNLTPTNLQSKRNLNALRSLYDLDLFKLNTLTDNNTNGMLFREHITCSYYSPHSFRNIKLTKNEIESSFSIFHINIVSINKNLENLVTELLEELDFHFDIIGVTETKITDASPIGKAPKLEGYNFEHVPTPLTAGGVGLFINDTLSDYDILEKTSTIDFQALWIEIQLTKDKNIICGILYRQHNSASRFLSYFEETIEKYTASGKNVYVIGDFNICLMKSEISNISNDFLLSLQSCYLIPTIDKPTRVRNNSASLIDNIFVNNPNHVLISGNIISDISDHFSQFCIIKSPRQRHKINKTKIRDYSRFSEYSYASDVAQVNWNEMFLKGGNDIDKIFSTFYNKLNEIVNRHAPMKLLSRRKIKQFSKPWITRGIRSSIKVKNKLFANGEEGKYKLYRNAICTLVRKSKRHYFHKYFNNNLTNMKKTWDGINTLLNRQTKKHKPINSLKDCFNENKITKDTSKMANIFNKYFASIGESLAQNLPASQSNYRDFLWKSRPPDTTFLFNPVNPTEVQSEILSLPINKAYGLYSCPIRLLKCASTVISNFLAEMYNFSITAGRYPSKLKMAMIIPIFKDNDKSEVNNYRPISLLSVFNKLFEKIMYNRMKQFIEQEDILFSSQYGFRESYSTEHAIHDIVDKIQTNMDKKLFSCGIFIDLKKAFDTVDHDILLQKLNYYGFRGITNDWFASYLKRRTQTTQIEGKISDKSNVSCGVPQGSVLGPLLFLLYINDIHTCSEKLSFYIFADDTNLLYSDKNLKTLEFVINTELKKVHQWLVSNKLSLNTKKTNFIIFHPYQKKLTYQPNIFIHDNDLKKDVALECKDYVKYLGILIDKNISWKKHIDTVTAKISKIVGIISKIRHFVPFHTVLTIYQSLILPHLKYGLTIWGQANKTYLNKILLLQKRVLRLMFFADRRDHAIPFFITANILPLSFLYHHSLAVLMHDVNAQKVPPNISKLFQYTCDVHTYNTRSSSSKKFFMNSVNLELRKKSLAIYGSKLWNEIPDPLKKLPKPVFKRTLTEKLLNILREEDTYIESPIIIEKLKLASV